jgi:outer membrane lipoprotein-sorting protein
MAKLLRLFALLPAVWLASLAHANAALSAKDITDLARVSAYLNSISTLQAGFVQVGPNGELDQGTVWAKKPGRMRFEYAPPSPYLIVSDGQTIAVSNSQLRTMDRYPLLENPLSVILKDGIDIARDANVVAVDRQSGTLRVTARQDSGPLKGQVTLIFSDPAIELRQWIITDAQGLQTMIALKDMKTEVQIDPSKFTIQDVNRFQRKQD